jgi:hypothetical protein
MEVIVLAANRVSSASGASTADDGDGGAAQADEDIEVLEDNAQESEDGTDAGVRCLLDAVAALDGASVAGASNGGGGTRSSDSDGGGNGVATWHGRGEDGTREGNDGGGELHCEKKRSV